HNFKSAVCLLFFCQFPCSFYHIRCQIGSHCLMSLLCQQDGKETGSSSYIQNLELLSLGQILFDFQKPSLCHGTVEFCPFLSLKAAASLTPVSCDPFFSVILISGNSSIGNHGTAFQHLQASCLKQDHSVILRPAYFQYVSMIIFYKTQDLAFSDHISGNFIRIPESCERCSLISHILHL